MSLAKNALINRPDIFEVMDLPPGTEKVTCETDARVPNCSTFTLWLEDHTIGNLLRMQLLRDKNVAFAAYRLPHPLENKLELRIQAVEQSTPEVALRQTLHVLQEHVQDLQSSFKDQVAHFLPQ